MQRIILESYGYLAEIDPARGGNLLRLRRPALRAESLRTPDADGGTDAPFLYGTPLLFPPNRIAGGTFTFEGRRYAFPVNEPRTGCSLHGAMNAAPFRVTRADAVSAEMIFEAAAGAYLGFPHAFSITLRYALSEGGLLQEAFVKNESVLAMPFALGWHTTFRLPFADGGDASGVRLRLSAGREYLRDPATYLLTGETRDDSPLRARLARGEVFPAREPLSHHFRQGAAHEMTLTDPRAGVSVRYETPDYGFWMLYNAGSDRFVCVEPQTWMVDAPHAPWDADETGLAGIPAGGARRFAARFGIESAKENSQMRNHCSCAPPFFPV